jgi:hypothetical protein
VNLGATDHGCDVVLNAPSPRREGSALGGDSSRDGCARRHDIRPEHLGDAANGGASGVSDEPRTELPQPRDAHASLAGSLGERPSLHVAASLDERQKGRCASHGCEHVAESISESKLQPLAFVAESSYEYAADERRPAPNCQEEREPADANPEQEHAMTNVAPASPPSQEDAVTRERRIMGSQCQVAYHHAIRAGEFRCPDCGEDDLPEQRCACERDDERRCRGEEC